MKGKLGSINLYIMKTLVYSIAIGATIAPTIIIILIHNNIL